MQMSDFVHSTRSPQNFVLPLPSPGKLHCSKEIAFFENIRSGPVAANEFEEELCQITEQAKKKSFNSYREYCSHGNEPESSFLSLLQYLVKAGLTSPRMEDRQEYLLLVGGNWRATQFVLLNELYPHLEIHLWSCKVQDIAHLPACVKRKHGFPSASTYANSYPVHLFSEFRSYSSSSIMHDLDNQATIVHNCQPLTASVRFRPPFRKDFDQDAIFYFDGEMQTVCYGGPSNTATRIFFRRQLTDSPPSVRRAILCEEEPAEVYAKKRYALFAFEQMLNYYNTEVRSLKNWNYGNFSGAFDDCYRNFILSSVLETDNEEEIAVFWERIVTACRSFSPKL